MHDRLHRPIRPDHQEAGGRPPPRQQRQQVQGRVIAPVQVFEDQDQGRLRRQRVHHFGKLPQHALPRHPLEFVAQLLPVRGREQPGHLHQPGGGMLPQQRHQALPARAPTELPQGLQDRQIGFPRAVVFHALASGQPHRRVRRDCRTKRLDHGGLAHPRLARHPHDLALPLARLRPGLPQALQHGLASDQKRRGSRCESGMRRRRNSGAL